MKIGQLARNANLNASAVRYYEKRGLLAAPQRLGGQRRYPPDAVHRVLLIRFASDMGFTLSEIKLFLSGLRDNAPVGPRWKKLAARKLIEVEQNIARSLKLKALLQGLRRCHCASLQQCVRALGLSKSLRSLSGDAKSLRCH
jgi:MerR family transcriptional regulator, redox-sensitive transcriptional activator SoxR